MMTTGRSNQTEQPLKVPIVESLDKMTEMPQRAVAFASIPITLVPYTPQPGREVYNFDTSFLQHSKKV